MCRNNSTKLKSNLYWVFFLLLCFTACNSDVEIAETNKDANITPDSFKFIFGNVDQRDFDSIYMKAAAAINEEGFRVDQILEKIAAKDTNAYEYYAIYAFQLAQNNHVNSALKCLDAGSRYLRTKDRSRFYLHKALMWGLVPPVKHSDTVYKYLDLAVKYDSLNPFIWATRSQFYREDSLYEKAINDIDKCLELRPGDTDYVNCRGWYKLCSGDAKGALKDLNVLSITSKNNALYHMYRAVGFDALSKYKESYKEANVCIQMNPTIGKAYVMRANAKYHYLKDKEGAFADTRKAAVLGDVEAINFVNKLDSANRVKNKN